jgi:hypothetical protein
VLRSKVEAEITKLFGKGPNPLVIQLFYLLDHCENLMAYQKQVDHELRRFAFENDVCKRFMEIPGVGPIGALTFYTAVGEPARFRRTADVGSYLGLTPKLHHSGLTQRVGRISKMGHVATRTLLVRASTHFMRCSAKDTALIAWASQVEQRRGRGRARIALARKLATIMLAMWKTGEPYRPRYLAGLSQLPKGAADLDLADP